MKLYSNVVRFALVDTNINDLESYREASDETFLIRDFEMQEYFELASGKLFLEADPYFTQWMPPNYRFRPGQTSPAGQSRIESRVGLFYQMRHKGFVSGFRQLLEQLKSPEQRHAQSASSEIRIIICFSVAGGMGSGSHLPIAYMLRDQANELGRPSLIGVAVLPAVFEDLTGINRDGTFANGYAALKEMEHLMKLGAPDSRFYPEEGLRFHYDPSDVSKLRVREPPFDFVYVVDKPDSVSVEQPIQAAADGLYFQFFSPLYKQQALGNDNYTQHQRLLVPHDFEAKGILGFTTFYGSYGAAVLRVPEDGLVEYCTQAAVLSLIRSSFLRAVPGMPVYALLRNQPASFHEVTLGSSKGEKIITVSELQRQEPLVRERILDRLFMKRVHMLAFAEYTNGEAKRFLRLFNHGHRLAEVPKEENCGFELRPELLKEAQVQLAMTGMRYSICAIVMAAITGDGNQPPGLLSFARREIELRTREKMSLASTTPLPELVQRAKCWIDELSAAGIGLLNGGYKEGGISYPGMDSLVSLDFLSKEAGDVDLLAKRYAVLSLLERVDWELKLPERISELTPAGIEGEQKVEASAQALVKEIGQQAVELAMVVVSQTFIERMGDLQKTLRTFAATYRQLEEGIDILEKEQLKRMEGLRHEGGIYLDQYALQSEALQIEDGRRMWDFYYEDQIAEVPELSFADGTIQRLLIDTVTTMSLRHCDVTSMRLQKLFDTLYIYVKDVLGIYISGDPNGANHRQRVGLTLSDALELEVVYRGLYKSNVAEVEQGGHDSVRSLITAYRHLLPEQQIQAFQAPSTDYIRDKVKHLINEKLLLLCNYHDESARHSGVRPNHIYLAAIDSDFANNSFSRAMRSADPRFQWVANGWHNPKEIIVYESVLNVPLFVFGRLHEMKEFYHQFRSPARRHKLLHIDTYWEESLPDLDPESAQELHRQALLRDHVINFAALLTSRPNSEAGRECIVRRQGSYWLVDPGRSSLDREEGGLTALGENLTDAIEKLPHVLEAEKVKYFPYRRMLGAVREGLAPRIVAQIVKLPFYWRRKRDELRVQYGSLLTPDQFVKLKDYSDAYHRLQEALDSLLERLRNRSVEQRAISQDDDGFGITQTSSDQAKLNLSRSLELLTAFSQTWHRLETPDYASGALEEFQTLFHSLDETELAARLKQIREGETDPQPSD